MVWYRLSFMGEVKKVEVLRETEKFVIVMKYGGECRVAKYGEYFSSFAELKDFVIEKQKSKILSIRSELERAEKRLIEANNLQEPLNGR